ncbi:hypothetical protein [Streptomyces sp. NBC_01012]|uniref:hypothetical protein n=1 Tax=Streptomyces sp. NBC_01012 TaxID=2903717 RepID=UPI00386FB019|nr:hypothetical protein OG623_03310 [Streptomyces sp. NBC_01012]
MRAVPKRRYAGLAVAAAMVAVPLSTGPAASAATARAELNGDWAPFSRCPVDDPAMLAADGEVLVATCVSSHSPSGSIKLGSTEATTGANDMQFGVVQDTAAGTFTVVPPDGGALVGEPTEIPGGLLGLMCPDDDIPVISDLCESITDATLNKVTATVESAGTPTEFNLTSGLVTGRQIVKLPIRIRLENPLLGSTCYIGSESDPVVLRPQNTTPPAVEVQRFDVDGTRDAAGAMLRFALTGNDQGDSAFAVPKATGCGPFGSLSWAVNLKTGLPSAAGNNNLVLNNASTYSGGLTAPGLVLPNAGKVLSEYWHSAAD